MSEGACTRTNEGSRAHYSRAVMSMAKFAEVSAL